MVQKIWSFRLKRRKGNTLEDVTFFRKRGNSLELAFFRKDFTRDELFHLNSHLSY